MSRWFRLYDEVLDDPKVQKLSPEHFKTWINLLCLASKNDGILPDAESVSFALRKPFNETSDKLKFLFQSGLLDETKKGLIPHGWSKRQYKSDTSTDRVKRFRQRSRNVEKTVTVTPPDTETEQRQIQTQKRTEFKRGSRLPQNWLPRAEDGKDDLELAKFRDYWKAAPGQKGVKLDWDATWRNWLRTAGKSPTAKYNGSFITGHAKGLVKVEPEAPKLSDQELKERAQRVDAILRGVRSPVNGLDEVSS